jgi:protease-4
MKNSGDKPGFSQRHPFIFGVMLILVAMVLLGGAMAALRLLLFGEELAFAPGDKLGIVRLEGFISDSEKVNSWIAELKADDSVKGVILRVNSPGGVVAPSQEMFHAVKRLAKVKPVVCSMSSLAASGGYYVAAGADVIFANPGTITGSIGVKAELADVRGLMEKLGIRHEQVVTGKYKGMGSPFHELTPAQRKQLQTMLDDIHSQFVGDVAAARDMTPQAVDALAQGQAFTGRQASKNGLVDKLGGLDDAIVHLKDLCKLEGPVPLRDGPPAEKESLLLRLLTAMFDFKVELPGTSGLPVATP